MGLSFIPIHTYYSSGCITYHRSLTTCRLLHKSPSLNCAFIFHITISYYSMLQAILLTTFRLYQTFLPILDGFIFHTYTHVTIVQAALLTTLRLLHTPPFILPYIYIHLNLGLLQVILFSTSRLHLTSHPLLGGFIFHTYIRLTVGLLQAVLLTTFRLLQLFLPLLDGPIIHTNIHFTIVQAAILLTTFRLFYTFRDGFNMHTYVYILP